MDKIDKLKYIVCCPMCDLRKCLKGTNQCDAEIWAKQNREEMENEPKEM